MFFKRGSSGDLALAALSRLMIHSARTALIEEDYVNALQYMLSVASVDQHPDVTIALAVTVLDVVDASLAGPFGLDPMIAALLQAASSMGLAVSAGRRRRR